MQATVKVVLCVDVTQCAQMVTVYNRAIYYDQNGYVEGMSGIGCQYGRVDGQAAATWLVRQMVMAWQKAWLWYAWQQVQQVDGHKMVTMGMALVEGRYGSSVSVQQVLGWAVQVSYGWYLVTVTVQVVQQWFGLCMASMDSQSMSFGMNSAYVASTWVQNEPHQPYGICNCIQPLLASWSI